MFEFTVEVRDKTLARIGQILPEDLNLTATIPFNNVGSWTLTLANAHPMVPVLKSPGAGIIVTRSDLGTVLFSGPTVSPSVEMSAKAPDGMLTISGVTDDVILADRLAYPQPSNSDASSQAAANDTRTGSAEDLMFAYVDANIGPSAVAPNLMTGDASTFEATSGGWINSSNGPVARTTAVAHSGTAALQTTATAAGTVDIASCSAASIATSGKAVSPGDAVILSAWTRAATTGRSVGIAGQFYDASGVNVGTLFGTRVTNTTTGWTQITANVTAPAAAAYVRVLVEITSAAASEVHYIDDVTLQRNYGRRDLRVTLGTNGHRGATLTKGPRFQPLGALLDEIATVADSPAGSGRPLGFRVVQVAQNLQFQTYATANNASAVRFDVDNGTLASSKIAIAAPNVTRTIVAGQGDGTARTILDVSSSTSLAAETAWSRRIETFIDQRQTNDTAQLTAAANEALTNGGLSQFAMQITPADDTIWVYGVDYSLGDAVTVVVRTGGDDSNAGTELSTTVTGYVLKADSSGKRFGALLGQPNANQQADFSARLSNLERSGSTGLFSGLSDVGVTSPSTYDILTYDGATGKWKNTNVLRLGSSLTAAVVNTARASTTDDGYASSAIGDTNGRFFIDVSGKQRWGGGTSATDTFLYRTGAGALKTDGDLNVAGNLTGAGAPMQRQIFTAGGTWTKPAGAKWVRVICVGGGGGGGGVGTNAVGGGTTTHGGGGQAGSYSESYLAASTFGTSATVTIGSAGGGGTGATNGGNGGTSSLGAFVTAPGGIGGGGSSANGAAYGIPGGNGASAGTGQIATAGTAGGYGFGYNQLAIGGTGAGSQFGGGGGSGSVGTPGTSSNGGNATGYGGGGGGAAGAQGSSSVASPAANGGAGSAGLVIVDTYF